MTQLVTVLDGDGIGPEVMRAAVRVCREVLPAGVVEWSEAPFGAAACQDHGDPFPEVTRRSCQESAAVLLGAVGGDGPLPAGVRRPEAGLLELRKELGAFANLRPVRPHPALLDASPLRAEILTGVDLLFVRELTGGIYFGAKNRDETSASDLCTYTVTEVERVVRKAAELAGPRRGQITSVDKANVLETSRLWREVTSRVLEADYPEIRYEHVLVDSMAMHLLSRPADFDVIVTENMFGDILTDEASVLAGSMGMLPSASLGMSGGGIFEPIHGSAPDIAGRGIANPCGAILSAAMMLRLALNQPAAADAIEAAVDAAITAGSVTPDLGGSSTTEQLTNAIVDSLT
jgi:3-isopropylmalate dehydrogenase